MDIRSRRDDDLRELGEVLLRVRDLDGYPVYLPGEDTARFLALKEGDLAWVAVLEERVVGHAALTARVRDSVRVVLEGAGVVAPFAHLVRLFVDPGARGRGVARALLDEVEKEATKRGRALSLDVVTRDHAALALYASRGWRRVGTTVLDLPEMPPFEEYVLVSSSD